MTSLLARKRFFSQESGSSHTSADDLPLLHRQQQQQQQQHQQDIYRCDSPPASGNYHASAGNLYAMDYSRIIPGRAHSTSIVRQRSGLSLSPDTKNRPRKSVSMFFSSTTTSSSSQSDSQIEYHHHHNNTYGMLNPGPLVRTNSGNHHRLNMSLAQNWVCTLVAIMGLLTLCTLAASTWQHNTHLHHELAFKEQEIEMHLEHAHALERRVQSMRSETIHLHNRIEELEHPEPTEEELNIQRKVFHLEHYQEQLHKGIAAQSKRLLLEKFGPGPKYYIEMKLSFDPESNIVQDATTEIGDTIWLETAHIDDMPHTIHFFLEQVANGIYDNTSFYRNAPRFVQAGPGHDSHIQEQLEANQPSLAHLLVQEHNSDKLNHQQYTLGYPGRPGGPDFYLNLQDNSDQPTHTSEHHTNALEQTPDPCFARIIRGFNTLERIHRSNVLEEEASYRRKQHRMVHPVTIVSMKVHDAHGTTTTRR